MLPRPHVHYRLEDVEIDVNPTINIHVISWHRWIRSLLHLNFSLPLGDIGSLVSWCLSRLGLARIAADGSLRLPSSGGRT